MDSASHIDLNVEEGMVIKACVVCSSIVFNCEARCLDIFKDGVVVLSLFCSFLDNHN